MTQGICSRCGEDENGLDEFNICASCRDQENNRDDYADDINDDDECDLWLYNEGVLKKQ